MEDRSVLSATFGSALSIGGAGSEGVFDVETDAAGYSYVTGDFEGTVDFDLTGSLPGDADILTARGSRDAFLAKYAPDDSLVWVHRMGGDVVVSNGVSDVGRNVSLDAAGNVYVVGQFFESSDFGSTTLTSAGSADAFVAKFTPAGSLTWANRWGTADHNSPHGVGVDANGNVYTVSHTYGRGYDIVKFNSNGAQSWSKLVAANPGVAADLVVSPSGNVYVAGIFQGTVDFDPSSKVKSVSAGPSQAYSAFVLNLDTNGKFKWVTPFVSKTVGSTWGYSMANSVSLDNSGNIYVGGHYHNTVDFNPGSGTTTLDPAGGAYLAKLNSAGGLVWARAFQSGSGSYVESIDVDAGGNIYAAGYFSSSIDLNPNAGVDVRSSAGNQDIFVVKLTASGSYVWGETFGGIGADVAYGVAVDGAGYVHVGGYFIDEVDFDSSPIDSYMLGTPGGSRNGFRLRLRQT